MGKFSKFDFYQINNKTTASEKLLYNIKTAKIKSKVTKEKTWDKLGTIIKLYKDWKDKAKTIE